MRAVVHGGNVAAVDTPRSDDVGDLPVAAFAVYGLHAGWDSSLLHPDVAYLARRGLLDRVDGLPPVPALKHRVRPYYIEGVRIDVGGIRIPFRTRGGTVCDIVCTLPSAVRASSFYWKRGQRIGEAGKPGPAMEVGGVYYGRCANEHQAGIFIKRIGTIRTDFTFSPSQRALRNPGCAKRVPAKALHL